MHGRRYLHGKRKLTHTWTIVYGWPRRCASFLSLINWLELELVAQPGHSLTDWSRRIVSMQAVNVTGIGGVRRYLYSHFLSLLHARVPLFQTRNWQLSHAALRTLSLDLIARTFFGIPIESRGPKNKIAPLYGFGALFILGKNRLNSYLKQFRRTKNLNK